MTLKELTERAKGLMPRNWGKRPVRVRDERRSDASLPTLRDPFGMLDEWFDRFLDGRFGESLLAPLAEPESLLGTAWPRVDLAETDNDVKITAEVPGMEADDLEVSLADHSLTIRGSKTTEREQRKKDYHLMETYSGSFHRTIPLPVEVDADGVEAYCRNGQLTITLPKTDAGRRATRHIEVK